MAPHSASESSRDEEYFEVFAKPLRLCARYKPKFGKGQASGFTLEQFQELYHGDPFYSWVGLDSPLMYAAHKAAGGMTSIYRQLGIRCQWLFNHVLQNSLNINAEQSNWSYEIPTGGGNTRRLSLDGRIEVADVRHEPPKRRVERWIEEGKNRLLLQGPAREGLKGVVFEVRQGYKSMDSKRQNADISNASSAYAHHYVPVLLLLSTQIDQALVQRYSQARWLLLRGTTEGNSTDSTYVFCREVLGYDLAGFFERNSKRCKAELETVLSTLLKAR